MTVEELEANMSKLRLLRELTEHAGWNTFVRDYEELLAKMRHHLVDNVKNMEQFWQHKGYILALENLIGFEKGLDAHEEHLKQQPLDAQHDASTPV